MANYNYLICAAFLVAAQFPNNSSAARILGVFPWPGRSHMITFAALTRALAEKGHELVVASTFPAKNPPANYTDINLWKSLEEYYTGFIKNTEMYDFDDTSKLILPFIYFGMGCDAMTLALNDAQMKNLLNDERGFDLVIAEDFMSDVLFGFAHHFKAPLILMSSFGGFHWSNYAVGNPYNPGTAPNNVLEYSDRKTFWERVENTLFTWYWDILCEFYFYKTQNQLKDDFFGPGLPSAQELRKTASLVLVNNHFSLNYPRPLVPAFVEVGGMHVKPSNKPLPKEFQNWMDGAKDGVIYFSMGSNLRSSLMPEEKRIALLAAFGELKQRVIWKYEEESLPGQPVNVMISNWVPQMDILAHPNMKLFITHGGLLSGQEAMYYGVPVVGIPIFGDQKMNVLRTVKEGYGVMLSIKNITKESVLSAINMGLNDQGIRSEVKRRQKVYLDQLETPLERAVFWTEYVLRHNGAPHMRSAALDLAWYQVELLDVYLFVLSIFFCTIFISIWVLKKVCCRTKKQAQSSMDKRKKIE